MVNNHYSGRYRILFDGTGTLGGSAYAIDGRWYIDFDGSGTNEYVDIVTSAKDDPVKNMRILPETLKEFHVIRFMDIQRTNFSVHRNWEDRASSSYYSQATIRGMSHEYAIALANESGCDAWVCVPHMASDEYIRKMAALWRDGLNSGLKVYLEFSNEVWNFGFVQFQWVNNNAVGGGYWNYPWPAAVDEYVRSDLAALSADPANNFPEKNAYMMERAFRIFNETFGSPDRVINVATGQSPWYDVTERVARYLDAHAVGTARAEALSVGGYFTYTEADHNYWIANPAEVTSELIMDRVLATQESFAPNTTWLDARETAKIARKYGLDFLVYEGGQHMQPFDQRDWPYNEALWDAQTSDKMYRMYMLTFAEYAKSEVDCKLYTAFHFIGDRKTRHGSWGHLESLAQLGSDYRSSAPKYQALLDANTER